MVMWSISIAAEWSDDQSSPFFLAKLFADLNAETAFQSRLRDCEGDAMFALVTPSLPFVPLKLDHISLVATCL